MFKYNVSFFTFNTIICALYIRLRHSDLFVIRSEIISTVTSWDP